MEWKDLVEQSGFIAGFYAGEFTFDGLSRHISKVEEFEQHYPQGFNRFMSLSEVNGLRITTDELRKIVERRRNSYKGPPVRTAVIASDPLIYGIARVYAGMMGVTNIEVSVFYTLGECALFIGVEEKLLPFD